MSRYLRVTAEVTRVRKLKGGNPSPRAQPATCHTWVTRPPRLPRQIGKVGGACSNWRQGWRVASVTVFTRARDQRGGISGAMDTRKIGRREAIGMIGAAGAAVALGCGSSPAAPSATVSAAEATGGSTNAACAATPAETAGPFPSLTHLFRSDIRDGKPGTLLNLGVKVVNTTAACAPVAGANVEIWHVDAAGNYSEYGSQTTQNFLRGVQTTNSSGDVSFTTIFPGWYQGRATHIHIEVTIGGTSRKVTQIAFPE